MTSVYEYTDTETSTTHAWKYLLSLVSGVIFKALHTSFIRL